jgi:hypothetical protein
MKSLAGLLCIALCAPCLSQTAQPSASDSTQELIKKSRAVPQAVESKDLRALHELLAPDFRMVGSEGQLHDRGELLGAAEEGALRNFMFYSPHVTRIDENSAIVTYNLIVTMPEGDDLMAPRYQKISDLWVRSGDEWRLKFEQATPLRSID